MNALENARKKINETDRKIAELFCERMEAVKEVALYKKERGLPVFDPAREEELLRANCEFIESDEIRSYYASFQRETMNLSKKYQHRLLSGQRVAYCGVEGAFAHIAAGRIFPDGELVCFPDFRSAYDSVTRGDCDCCVLPVENSYAGEVGQITDLMYEGSLFVNGIYNLQISQCLIGLPGTQISGITGVLSHPQALSQCAGYISEHGFEAVEASNTALAAREVAERGDPTIAAIASQETAALYGLDILDHDINESGSNATRFAVFSRTESVAGGGSGDRFILLFTVNNVAGALAGAISIIGGHGFNMKVLRSRPIKLVAWQYYFYVEAEGDITSDSGKKMLDELSAECSGVKVVGHYSDEVFLIGNRCVRA